MSRPKITTQTAAATAPIFKPEAATRQLGDEERNTQEARKRKGRSSLRIDPQSGGVASAAGAGINVPQK